MSTERVIVQRGISEKLIAAVKALCQDLKSGDVSNDSSVRLGALFAESSAEGVLKMIQEAQADGAEVVLGNLKREGAVLQPHLVKGVRPGMRLWARESFGPGPLIFVHLYHSLLTLAIQLPHLRSRIAWTKPWN